MYYDPFTIDDIEAKIGPFDLARGKPFESHVLRGPEGQRPLSAIGCAWSCGCDVRGPAYTDLRTCYWLPWVKHRSFELGEPNVQLPEELTGGIVVDRETATYCPDKGHLFEATVNSL
jgi:hypothetical protein